MSTPRNVTCLDMTPRADAHARELISAEKSFGRLGMRFKCTPKSEKFSGRRTERRGHEVPENMSLSVMEELQVKDYVLQPRSVVIFTDPSSYTLGYGVDIDWDGKEWVFSRSERKAKVLETSKKSSKKAKSKKEPAPSKKQTPVKKQASKSTKAVKRSSPDGTQHNEGITKMSDMVATPDGKHDAWINKQVNAALQPIKTPAKKVAIKKTKAK